MKIVGCFAIAALVIISGCNNKIKFDSVKWATKDDMEYPYRNKMLPDLTTNYKLTLLNYSELIKLLGKPQQTSSTSLTYDLIVNYDGIDPNYTKELELEFNKDSMITSFKVREWKK